MNQELQQLAMDMNLPQEAINAKSMDLEIFQRTNPVPTSAIDAFYGHSGYGMNLRPKNPIDCRYTHDVFIAQDSRELKNAIMAMDDAQYSLPSNGVLPYFTTIFNKDPIEQLLKTTASREMSEDWQQGEFGTTDIKMPTVSYGGNSEVYADQAGTGESSINMNWVPRQAVTLQRTLQYGDLTQAQMAMAKINYVGQMRKGLTSLTSLDINSINLYGFAGMDIYGLSNDPSLNPAVVFPASAANPASSLWIYKDFNEIVADIRSLFNEIISIAGGQANYTQECILALPPSAFTALSTQNTLSSVMVSQYCKEAFPGMKIIQCAQYQGTGSPAGSTTPSICQLIFKELAGQRVAYNIFSSLYNSHGVVRLLSSYAEKISYTVSGGFLALPVGVAIGSGC